jgi:uncharacterized protein (DUF427 family)
VSRYLPRGVVPVVPDPGQESAWDYPRPPRAEADGRLVVIEFDGVVARTREAVRVLETSHPPAWYLPRAAFADGVLRSAPGSSWCEFKGRADYLDIVSPQGRVAAGAAWTYPDPSPGFESIAGHVALYAGGMDCITVDGVIVTAQPGGFYGGWVTPDVVGPFKGGPGSNGW